MGMHTWSWIRAKIFKRRGLIFIRRNTGRRIFFWGIIICILTIFLFCAANNELVPTILAFAEAKAKSQALEIATDVINQKLEKMKYEDFIYIQKDSQAKVTAIQSNVVKMNRLSAEIASAIQSRMNNFETMSVKVPIGNIFGITFLSNRGPEIVIKILPYGNIDADFKTEFVSAGINQTRHKIYIEIKSKLMVAVPFVQKTTELITKVAVAETVIVGEVPQSFINIDSQDSLR